MNIGYCEGCGWLTNWRSCPGLEAFGCVRWYPVAIFACPTGVLTATAGIIMGIKSPHSNVVNARRRLQYHATKTMLQTSEQSGGNVDERDREVPIVDTRIRCVSGHLSGVSSLPLLKEFDLCGLETRDSRHCRNGTLTRRFDKLQLGYLPRQASWSKSDQEGYS